MNSQKLRFGELDETEKLIHLEEEIDRIKEELHFHYVLKENLRSKVRRKIRWKKLKSNPKKYQEHLLKHRKECEIWRKKNPKYSKEYSKKWRLNKLKRMEKENDRRLYKEQRKSN